MAEEIVVNACSDCLREPSMYYSGGIWYISCRHCDKAEMSIRKQTVIKNWNDANQPLGKCCPEGSQEKVREILNRCIVMPKNRPLYVFVETLPGENKYKYYESSRELQKSIGLSQAYISRIFCINNTDTLVIHGRKITRIRIPKGMVAAGKRIRHERHN